MQEAGTTAGASDAMEGRGAVPKAGPDGGGDISAQPAEDVVMEDVSCEAVANGTEVEVSEKTTVAVAVIAPSPLAAARRRFVVVQVLFSTASAPAPEGSETPAAASMTPPSTPPTCALSFVGGFLVSEQGGGAPRRARALFPCVDTPTSLHTFDFHFLVLPEDRVVSCGSLVGQSLVMAPESKVS